MDKRLFEIECWIKGCLGNEVGPLVPASSDASFRRYFRVDTGAESIIIMDAPPDKEDTEPFVYAAAALEELGLSVPHVRHRSASLGLLMLDDLGSRQYLEELNEDTAESLYQDAIDAIVRLQQGPVICGDKEFPPYDAVLLRDEMALFNDWYVKRHLDTTLDAQQTVSLQETISILCNSATEQPQTWVHRDYHSRNLMKLDSGNPGIIDFQDMVVGPISYDLVSLLKDCYIKWPGDRVECWIDYYLGQTRAKNTGFCLDRTQFIEWFDLMGVQRHLKVLGIFSRLNYRDGKQQYIHDLPMVLAYLQDACSRYPVLSALENLLIELHTDA